jgi:arabinan endo-1,5-alpha-L-arabinosidase
VLVLGLSLLGCGVSTHTAATLAGATPASATLSAYPLSGNIFPVRDPSIIRQGGTYYLFATDAVDAGQTGFLPIRCSADTISWSACGYVFAAMPAWVAAAVPGAVNLWAPDISYFNNLYHVYYAASTLESQVSVIGLATSPTLDSTSPAYHWTDQGEILSSTTGDNFNAIDPNILVGSDGAVWLNYGSFWTGIKQRSIDAATGKLSASAGTIYALAYRPLLDHAVEGASLVQHGGYYYLFISTGHCCQSNYRQDDYQEAMGRSASPHGPFLDVDGVDLEAGGGTVLLQANATWNAPGGGSAFIDASTGESLLVFHALKMGPDPTGYLWVKRITWSNDWPSLD